MSILHRTFMCSKTAGCSGGFAPIPANGWRNPPLPLTKLRRPSGVGSKNAAPKGNEKFAWVTLTPDGKGLLCKAASGHLYELPVSVLRDDEGHTVRCVAEARLIDYGHAAKAVLPSGAEVEFPFDFVLHHCEPAYVWHKSRFPPWRVGARIRALRQARGLTLTALAGKAGLAIPNLHRLEEDKHTPTFKTLQRVAKAFGLSWLDLLSERLG